jgi:uncharacterized repeat protein (TIGR03803 family)
MTKRVLAPLAASFALAMAACSQAQSNLPRAVPLAASARAGAAAKYQILYAFSTAVGGPLSGLVAFGSSLYGTTSGVNALSAPAGVGSIYRIGQSGSFHTIVGFRSGGAPAALAVLDGKIYGIGGTVHGRGEALLSIDPSGSVRIVRRYPKDLRLAPTSLIAANGILIAAGGPGLYGSVYTIGPSGKYRNLHAFRGGSDGASPEGIVFADGHIYGTTVTGGNSTACFRGCGTVFAVTLNGEKRTLHSFADGADGAYPAGLVNVNGTLYGVTSEGGANQCYVNFQSGPPITVGCGTFYSITLSGAERVIYNFKSGWSFPSGLISGSGTLYGMTPGQPPYPYGSSGIFSITADGALNILYDFELGSLSPISLVSVDGALFGTAIPEGGYRNGVIFKLKP